MQNKFIDYLDNVIKYSKNSLSYNEEDEIQIRLLEQVKAKYLEFFKPQLSEQEIEHIAEREYPYMGTNNISTQTDYYKANNITRIYRTGFVKGFKAALNFNSK